MQLLGKVGKYSKGQYIEGYKIVATLGEGRYGVCYLITDEKKLYILKQLKRKTYRGDPLKPHYEEKILKTLKHEAIPGFITKIKDRHSAGYILEYKQGVTLEDLIFNQGHVFTRAEIYSIGKQLIDIMKYLNEKGIVHRDIRVPNILLDGSRVYLVDFGLARWVDNEKYKADIDFSYFGDLLIHLFYTAYTDKPKKGRPWYEELALSTKELIFLKKLIGIENRYMSITEVELGFEELFRGIGGGQI